MSIEEKVYNELSDSNFAAAVASFVKNYGGDVPSAEGRRPKTNLGTGAPVSRPCGCCSIPHSLGTNGRGSNAGME